MTENKKRQRCDECGVMVAEGCGLLTRELRQGQYVSVVRHREGECVTAADAPMWLQYAGACLTVGGNRADSGATIRVGELPADAVLADWVPANDKAAEIKRKREVTTGED